MGKFCLGVFFFSLLSDININDNKLFKLEAKWNSYSKGVVHTISSSLLCSVLFLLTALAVYFLNLRHLLFMFA